MSEQQESSGHTLFQDPHHERADLRMLRTAIKNRWPISKSLRGLAIEKIKEILSSGDSSETAQIAAIKVLIAADALNARREEAPAKKGSPVNVNVVGEGAKVQVIEVVAPAPRVIEEKPPERIEVEVLPQGRAA